jgi:hypothetical protein
VEKGRWGWGKGRPQQGEKSVGIKTEGCVKEECVKEEKRACVDVCVPTPAAFGFRLLSIWINL